MAVGHVVWVLDFNLSCARAVCPVSSADLTHSRDKPGRPGGISNFIKLARWWPEVRHLFAQQPSSIVLLPNWKYNKKERDAPAASLYVYNTCGGGVFTMLCILDLSHHWLKGFAGERICCRGDKRGVRVKTFLVLFLMKQQLEISGRRRSCRDERRRKKGGGPLSLLFSRSISLAIWKKKLMKKWWVSKATASNPEIWNNKKRKNWMLIISDIYLRRRLGESLFIVFWWKIFGGKQKKDLNLIGFYFFLQGV